MTLNILVSVVVAFFYIGWMPPSQLSSIVIYVAVANFIISILSLGTLPPETPREDQKYFVKKINGAEFGSVAEGNSFRGKFFVNGLDGLSASVTCERETMNQALWEAYQLAKKHTNMVFTVTNTRGNQLALVNHSDVSVQMIKSKFGF